MSDTQIANAKLTTYLHITGVRGDGYHLIDSEMVSLDLADQLTFTEGDGVEVVGSPFVPSNRTNLILQALDAAGRRAQVRVEKRIPVGGGLGGGSTDAAAALRWAESADIALAAQLGADVPFCLQGGRARVGGIGDQLEQLPFEERHYTLLVPPFGVNTAAVYSAYDELAAGFAVHAQNDLELAACLVEPRLVEWRDKFTYWTGETALLAGSGATWFVAGVHESPPQADLQGARWIVTKTVPALW